MNGDDVRHRKLGARNDGNGGRAAPGPRARAVVTTVLLRRRRMVGAVIVLGGSVAGQPPRWRLPQTAPPCVGQRTIDSLPLMKSGSQSDNASEKTRLYSGRRIQAGFSGCVQPTNMRVERLQYMPDSCSGAMSQLTHWARTPFVTWIQRVRAGRRDPSIARGVAGDRYGFTVQPELAASRKPQAPQASPRRSVQYERPIDLDRLVQRISYRTVLGHRQLDRPKRVRPVDPFAVHDVSQVDVGQPGRRRVRALALDLDLRRVAGVDASRGS